MNSFKLKRRLNKDHKLDLCDWGDVDAEKYA